ncbi:MAG: T9SS type A sorting domain-containing protein [Candidatus Latescibacterota bacterium]|nr:MAG: T9SS type A sorting domain-containing protein [Candidatus Latescibacterota bacterium]
MSDRKRLIIWVTILTVAAAAPTALHAADRLIFTANQEFLSRIYVMDMDGNVVDYHQYDFYRWVGMEVVDGELYVAEAFAPRVYKVNPATGDLDVFIDDWSLFYFYDVAFDGTYFYVDEWDLNRYDINGDYAGTASFDENVLGCAWDGTYFWTLDDTNLIKCWDLSSWPTVTAVPDNDFTPPSPNCRGLYFDGELFWSAESGDSPGWIYRFTHDGKPVDQWPEPAFSGWGAALVVDEASGIDPARAASEIRFGIESIYPNPFNPNTTLTIVLPEPDTATLSIYDALGKRIATILSAPMEAGTHALPWNAEGLASGVYWARLESGNLHATRKMVLLK